MTGLLVLALSLVAPESRLGDTSPTCVVPEGRVVAQSEVGGVEIRARAGALEVDGLTLTPCEGLPGAYPTALAVAGDQLYVGFRAAGLYRYAAGRFERVDGVGDRAVRALAASGAQVWVGTDRGLLTVTGTRAKRVRHWVLGRREVTALHVAGDGALHVGAGPYGWWRMAGHAEPKRVDRGVFAGCFSEVDGRVRAHAPGGACG